MEEDELGGKKAVEQAEQPVGRAAWLEKYKSDNPESGDPDDDTLFGYAHDRHSDLGGKHEKLSGANARLSELVAKDPKLGAVISMIAGEDPKSLPYAIGKLYGSEPFGSEGEDPEEFEKGYRERLAKNEEESKQVAKNIKGYHKTLTDYGKENELDESQLDEVHQSVMQLADNFLMGIIPVEVIDLLFKGLNHDKDVQEAADTGFVEGKNERVDAKLKPPTAEASIPDLGTGANRGGAKKMAPPSRRGGSVFDDMKEIPGTGPGRRLM
jgi:hypothetical protein